MVFLIYASHTYKHKKQKKKKQINNNPQFQEPS